LFCHAWRFPIFEIRHGWRFLAGFSDLALPLGSLFLEDDLVIGHSVETDPGPALCNGRCAGCCGGRGRLAGPAYRGPGWPGRSHRRAAAHAGAQGSRAWPPLPRPAPGAKKEPQGGSSCGSICCVVLCWPDLIAPVAGPKTDTLGISVAGLCRSKHTETEPPIDMRGARQFTNQRNRNAAGTWVPDAGTWDLPPEDGSSCRNADEKMRVRVKR